jgi:hypothetical protein
VEEASERTAVEDWEMVREARFGFGEFDGDELAV